MTAEDAELRAKWATPGLHSVLLYKPVRLRCLSVVLENPIPIKSALLARSAFCLKKMKISR